MTKPPPGQELIRGATVTSVAAMAGIALDFVSFAIAARSVSQGDFGIFALFLVLGRFAQVLADFGLRPTLVHFLAAREGQRQETFGLTLGLQTVFGLVVAAALLLLIRPLGAWIGLGEAPSYLPFALGLFVIVQVLHQLFSGSLQGLRLYRRYAAGELTRSVSRLALLVLLVVCLHHGLAGLIASTVFGITLSCVLQFLLIPLPKLPKWSRVGCLDILRFAYPLGFNNLLGITFGRVDRLILAAHAGPASVALLETASRVPEGGTQLYMAFQSVFYPNMSSLLAAGRKREAAGLLKHTLRLVAFLTASIAVVALAAGADVVVLLFSGAYQEVAWGFAILTAGLTVALVNNVLHTTLIASGSSRGALQAGLFQGVVSIVFYSLAIPMLGYLGAIYGLVLGNLAVHPLYVWLLSRRGIRVEVGVYLKPMTLLLAVIIASLWLDSSAFFVLFAIIPFLVASFLLRCVTPQDLRSFWQALPSPAMPVTGAAK